MATRWVHVELDEQTLRALRVLAAREFREPRQQARALILDGLRRAGTLVEHVDPPERAAAR